MHQGDYSSFYYQYPPHLPNPNPDPNQNPYASAPPVTSTYAPSDYSLNTHNHASFSHNSDPISPTATAFSSQSTFDQTPPSQPLPSGYASYDTHGSDQQSIAQQSYYPPYDQHQTLPNYATSSPPASITQDPMTSTIPTPPYSSVYSAPYGHVRASVPPVYDHLYDNSLKVDQGGELFDDKYGVNNNNHSRSDLGSELYGRSANSGGYSRFDDGYGDGVYAYEGGKVEPYGARGTASNSSTWASTFDDYGRAISFPEANESPVRSASSTIARAVPKADTHQDVSGAQKFRVKLLAESGGQSTVDVLCQIGLDGIRMLDPNTSRVLRIYPLENVTRCDVTDSSTFAFWSKSTVDIEPKRIRLQSNSYTTNTLLDTVTAATVQIKEMGGTSKPSETIRTADQSAEKKKGFTDWVNMIKPGNEEKEHWIPDEAVTKCTACGTDFGAFNRKHHCRNCGDIFCDKCTHGRIALTADENAQPVRVCDHCMAEVTQRLINAKEGPSNPAGLQSHEDLARKLQEEMEKNRKASSGSKIDDNGSGRRMKEVACPTCTVHLQVQVPKSGSETIECGVCQHPFLVSS